MSLPIEKLVGLPAHQFDTEMTHLTAMFATHETNEAATKHLQTDALTHHFGDGLYAREIEMVKGTIVISRVHKNDCINVISKGTVVIATKDGIEEREAPYTFMSPSGTQRLVMVLESAVWTTIHAVDATTPEGLFEELTAESYKQYEKWLGVNNDICNNRLGRCNRRIPVHVG